MKINDNHKLRNSLIILASVILIIVAIVLYSLFMSNYIYAESAEHLEEVFYQLGDTFNQKTSDYQNVMFGWKDYIAKMSAEGNKEDLQNFINSQKTRWKMDYFYFIKVQDPDSPNGAVAKTVDGAPFNLNLRRNASVLLNEDDGGVVVRETDENGDITRRYLMFTMPFDEEGTHYQYDGFEYDTIGICFGSEALQESIQVNAFDNQALCFVVIPDEEGNVLLQSDNGTHIDKLLESLGSDSSFSWGGSLKTVQDYFQKVTDAKKNGESLTDMKAITLIYKTHQTGEEYYLTMNPVGFSDWIICGMVPTQVLNSNMSNFRLITIVVIAAIFACVVFCVSWLLLITSRRRVEEKEQNIFARERLLDSLTKNSNDIFVLFSVDTLVCEYVSGNVEAVLGLDVEEVRANVRTLEKAIEGDFSIFKDGIVSSLEGEKEWETDLSVKNVKTQNVFWYKLLIKKSTNKGIDSYILILSDRTKERKMNDDLCSALDIAKAANEAKSNFLSNMSHDIRTPMNAIIGFTTLLAKEAGNPEKVLEYVRKISFSSQHLLSLINDILDMSKIESGKSSLNLSEFNLPTLLEEQYTMILPQAKAKQQTFEIKTKGFLPEIVYGDKLRINQILLNLLSNAVKYTPINGNILLQVEAVEPSSHKRVHLRITVKDNGMGMSKEYLKVIFEPFSRENTVASREIQGTGLGMTITKQIVELMGGTISVDSEIGKGSTFVVDLELTVVTPEDAKEDKDFWKKHEIFKVLVVDDEEEICIDVQELMRETGVAVDYALTGESAVEKVKEKFNTPDAYNIVLLDWKMPGMDGIETARRIRQAIDSDIPIMILTSYDFAEIEDEARKAGINLFMSKPFFVSNFRHAIVQIGSSDGEDDKEKEHGNFYSLEGLKVLAAEDNEINAEILQELLDIEGATCSIAVNGKEALEMFEKSSAGEYDMIFMDVQMPVMNGYEATRAIRACSHPEAKTIPIIAMTANAFEDDVKTALDSGMNAHLAKPIDMLKLKSIIAELRGGKK